MKVLVYFKCIKDLNIKFWWYKLLKVYLGYVENFFWDDCDE